MANFAFHFLHYHLEGAAFVFESFCWFFFKYSNRVFCLIIPCIVVTAESFIDFITTFSCEAFENSEL